ncbi:MAG: hypothetical protein KU28_08980 [Sulfurovum sp. PC08-66]|jgi:hypothetical protein|nr:MAG: hypothetical protein KU28_08980 [Sulfurovum sp. PC08-66]
MDTQTKKNLIQWTKRIVTTLLVALWIANIIKIASFEVDFNQQATYCIFSTMIIFGVLIGIYQLIERYEGDLKE